MRNLSLLSLSSSLSRFATLSPPLFTSQLSADSLITSTEFRDLWHSLKTPLGDDLTTELQTGTFPFPLPFPFPALRLTRF